MASAASRRAVLVAALFAAPSIAHAHPLVDEARGLYEEAEFERAMTALSQAESARDLTREDLVELYRVRVLLRVAMEQSDALEADVERLLSLDPSFDFGTSAPSEVSEAMARLRRRITEPVDLDLRVEATPTGATIVARVINDPAGLARETRIRAQAGDGPWFGPLPSPLELPVSEGQSLVYHAEVIGPGGAVLARAGTAERPLRWSPGQTGPEGEPLADDSGLWIGLGIGIGVAVAAAIVITTVLVVDAQSGVSDHTRPQLPVIARF